MPDSKPDAHSYGYIDGLARFVLPCCEADVGVAKDVKHIQCPECGKGYQIRTLGVHG